MRADPKALVNRPKCNGCSICTTVCPTGAITMGQDGVATVNRKICIGCGGCVGVCPEEAIALTDDE